MNLFEHLHPALVHFPIALLLVASAAGLFYLWLWRWQHLPPLAWICMLLGWATGLLAVLTGLVAQQSLPPRPPYATVINLHIGGGLAILVVYGLLLYRAWMHRKRAGKPNHGPAPELLDQPGERMLITLLLVLGALLVIYTGFNGGQLVYVWGVNVAQ